MNRSVFMPLAVATVAAFALAGCSAGGGGELDPFESPLSVYTSAIYGAEKDQHFYDAQQLEIEELVASCMAEEGFDYVPVDYSEMYRGGGPPTVEDMREERQERGTEEWIAQYGYGFSTIRPSAIDLEQPEFPDPNRVYTESLSPAEQAEYYEILHGASRTREEMRDENYEHSWKDEGCQGAARNEVRGEPAYENKKYESLLNSIGAIRNKVQDAPTIVALDVVWASCMVAAGYHEYENKQDAQNAIAKESNKLLDATGEHVAGPELRQIRKLEIDTALADFHCSENLDYQNAMTKVQFKLEEQFIADNRAELDEMVAEYEFVIP